MKAKQIDDKVMIEVIDNWVWIPEDKLENIFSKFYQVDSYKQRKVEWLWLWLALCQTILKDFWSEVKVKSKLWEWSNFNFTLDLIA